MKKYKNYPGVKNPPKKTKFTYPNGFKLKGEVVDEVRIKTTGKGGDYLFVIQKIEYEEPPDETKENPWIRFGYYRKEHNEKRYRWGSQTTFHIDIDSTNEIIKKAIYEGIMLSSDK